MDLVTPVLQTREFDYVHGYSVTFHSFIALKREIFQNNAMPPVFTTNFESAIKTKYQYTSLLIVVEKPNVNFTFHYHFSLSK